MRYLIKLFRKGKTTCFDAWLSFPKLKESVDAFIELRNTPSCFSTENLNILEEFVMSVYFGKEHTYTDINEACHISFFKTPDPKLSQTVLSRRAFCEHAKSATYQSGWLWRECVTNVILPDPQLWGWKLVDDTHYIPLWHFPEGTEPNIDSVISICGCRTTRCVRCKCATSDRKCLEYCNSRWSCLNL